ncbi:MAG: T9SS type A sorting domain-containing protein [Bacteroidetes bacterium]|nr:T9SS type A sorting domain-containing protein [Bacteroidota bacterium]
MKPVFVCLLCMVSLALQAQFNWIKQALPVLPRSAVYPNWDGVATADACALLVNDTFKLWYSGAGWLSPGDTVVHVRIGYAWSLDGISWNEFAANPVLDRSSSNVNAPDHWGVETANVIYDTAAPPAERYRMWYAGKQNDTSLSAGNYKICYATSPNGINWTKYAGNPVLTAGTASDWNNLLISNVSVLRDGDTLKLWFASPDGYPNNQPTDGKGNIGYATSTDGINWTKYPNPVLVAGAGYSPDSAAVAEPSVLKIGNQYYMWYSMINSWTIENFTTGLAHSTDGINWIKYVGNPVLPLGGPGSWDRYWAAHPGVMYNAQTGELFMYYTGRDSTVFPNLTNYSWDIGLARSTFYTGFSHQAYSITPHTLIYPVPATDVIYIRSNETLSAITLRDISGRVVNTARINGTNATELSLNALPPGHYVATITYSSGLQTNHKFIVQ